jgi:hypothetical protein
MEYFKNVFAISIAAILAYFEPIKPLFAAILLLVAVNFVVGLAADLLVGSKAFRFSKAFACIREATLFMLLLATAYYVGDHLRVQGLMEQILSTIAYTLAYFYAVNILKNLRQIFPKNKPIAIFYDLLSIEILSKLPGMDKLSKKQLYANPA